MSWTINIPLRIPVTKRKKFSLNLNQYRNAHYHTLDKAKKNFKKIVTPQIRELPVFERCTLKYVLYPRTRQLCDISNLCSIADKFFADALVELNKIEDDNYKNVPKVIFEFGEIDRKNPRIEVTIIGEDSALPVNQERKDEVKMRFVMTQADLEKAVRSHVENLITIKEGTRLQVSMEGDIVNVDLVMGEAPSEPVKTVPKLRKVADNEQPAQKAPSKPVETPKAAAAPSTPSQDGSPSKSLFAKLQKPVNN